MADFSTSVKQKMFKTISFRFPSAGRTESALESISEESPAVGKADVLSSLREGLDVRHRPLPQLPQHHGESMQDLKWYKSVSRQEAEDLVRNATDGNFIVRPSIHGQTDLAITLWYQKRSYNIPIRLRSDGKYALGTLKYQEQTFANLEEMIENYKTEEIILYSGGLETGRTILRESDLK